MGVHCSASAAETTWKRQRGLPFLVLDFRLDIVDCIGRFDLEGNSLAGEGLNKDLHGCSSERAVKGVRN